MAENPGAEQKSETELPTAEIVEGNGAAQADVEVVAEPADKGQASAAVSAKAAAKMKPTAAPAAEIQALEVPESWLRTAIRQTPSWLISMVVHVIVLLVLALVTLPPEVADEMRQLVIAPSEMEEIDELEDLNDELLENIDVNNTELLAMVPQTAEDVDVTMAEDVAAAAVSVELSDIGLETAPKNDLLTSIGAFTGSALSGRGEGKARLVAQGGGNEASERSVAAGLMWLAEHQFPDGGWSFNHAAHPGCRGQCRNSGELAEARNAATGLALLPFLGAGQTHKTGKYKNTVRAGLYFLVNKMKVTPQGGSLLEGGGSMYSHGIAAIVLCEAYAMTNDKGLYGPAQQAVNFICSAQDPVGGGWRYQPRQKGDTSVVGWQLMALKSGHMGYLQIPPPVIKKASLFLDTVQANNGANYGYTTPGSGPATTAVGLLCRMYLGWKHDHPALERGVKWMGSQGPHKTNMYYNYYATQVMRHWEGELWDKWNKQMRDQLVESQATQGHEKGSWYIQEGFNERGGRLYCTSMATMILEVYYRHLPIYRKQSTEEEFPLD
jgi:hypothetical protein